MVLWSWRGRLGNGLREEKALEEVDIGRLCSGKSVVSGLRADGGEEGKDGKGRGAMCWLR